MAILEKHICHRFLSNVSNLGTCHRRGQTADLWCCGWTDARHKRACGQCEKGLASVCDIYQAGRRVIFDTADNGTDLSRAGSKRTGEKTSVRVPKPCFGAGSESHSENRHKKRTGKDAATECGRLVSLRRMAVSLLDIGGLADRGPSRVAVPGPSSDQHDNNVKDHEAAGHTASNLKAVTFTPWRERELVSRSLWASLRSLATMNINVAKLSLNGNSHSWEVTCSFVEDIGNMSIQASRRRFRSSENLQIHLTNSMFPLLARINC